MQWFEPLQIEADEIEKSLRVVFPHSYFGQWFCQNVQPGFEEQVLKLLGPGYFIDYSNVNRAGQQPPTRNNGLKATEAPFGAQFTFDSFIVNNKNHFPVVSAREVASQGKAQYNPFVICGESASGKTHILKAMGNELCTNFERGEIFFGSLEKMADIYSNTFAGDHLRARRYFMDFKCLMIDDLQQIKEHPQLQEELIQLFNDFHDSGRQMAFCCTGRLADYEFLDQKLKSRLEWGLIITLKEPDLDVRVKYIQSMCRNRRIKLNKEQVLTLAQRFTDLRYLQGILLKIFAFKKLVHKNIQDKDFNQILDNAVGESSVGLDPDSVIKVVAEHFKVQPKILVGNKRDRAIVHARQVAMFLCRQLIGSSYPSLGKIFGGKDHSTAMYAVNKIKEIQDDDPHMQRLLTSLKKKCLQAAQ